MYSADISADLKKQKEIEKRKTKKKKTRFFVFRVAAAESKRERGDINGER